MGTPTSIDSTMLVTFSFLPLPPLPPLPNRPRTFSVRPLNPAPSADRAGPFPSATPLAPVTAAIRPGPPPPSTYSLRRPVVPPTLSITDVMARSPSAPASPRASSLSRSIGPLNAPFLSSCAIRLTSLPGLRETGAAWSCGVPEQPLAPRRLARRPQPLARNPLARNPLAPRDHRRNALH